MLSGIRKNLFRLDDSKIVKILYNRQCNISPSIMYPSYRTKQTHLNELIKRNGVTEFHSRKWSLDLFKENVPPLIIGTVNPYIFSKRDNDKDLWAMDLPIKMPRSDIRIPQEFSQFKEFIKKVFTHESITNPNLNDWYTYLCVDQRPVEPSFSQRRPGAHVDSFPTGRINMNRLSDSIYIGYDCLPTEFCLGNFAFRKGIDTSNNSDILKHFEENTRETKRYECYNIVKIDSGHVHQVSMNKNLNTVNRTFIKVVFSPDVFNRVGNDHNYLFEYNWPLYERTVERNNSSILDGYVNNDAEFEYIPFDKLYRGFGSIGCNWLDDKIISVRRKGQVLASLATEGELLATNDKDGNFLSCMVAKKNDWKIRNPSTGSEYFIPTNKFIELYDIQLYRNGGPACRNGTPTDRSTSIGNSISVGHSTSAGRSDNINGPIKAKGLTGTVRRVIRNIKIDAPWGTVQYLRKGDVIIKKNNGEVYGISNYDFSVNYDYAGKLPTNEYLYKLLSNNNKLFKTI